MKTFTQFKIINLMITKAITTSLLIQAIISAILIYPMIKGVYELGFYPSSVFLLCFLGSLFGWGGYSYAKTNGLNTKFWGTFCMITGPFGWLMMDIFRTIQFKN